MNKPNYKKMVKKTADLVCELADREDVIGLYRLLEKYPDECGSPELEKFLDVFTKLTEYYEVEICGLLPIEENQVKIHYSKYMTI